MRGWEDNRALLWVESVIEDITRRCASQAELAAVLEGRLADELLPLTSTASAQLISSNSRETFSSGERGDGHHGGPSQAPRPGRLRLGFRGRGPDHHPGHRLPSPPK